MQLYTYFFSLYSKYVKYGKISHGGRNFLGRICVYHKGFINKQLYVYIDYLRRINLIGNVYKIIYDSNRNSFLGLIIYANGLLSFFILAEGLFINDIIFSGSILPKGFSITKGSAVTLHNMPLFSIISHIELLPYQGAKYIRSAGSSAVLIGKKGNLGIIKLTSGWQIFINLNCLVMLGNISNSIYKFIPFCKAGKSRAKGIRPTVRGVAKNPCDHPHGGGNGKKSPPCAQVTPWGKFCKGTPTTNKKYNRLYRRKFKNLSI